MCDEIINCSVCNISIDVFEDGVKKIGENEICLCGACNALMKHGVLKYAEIIQIGLLRQILKECQKINKE
jgi:hypothetical protein